MDRGSKFVIDNIRFVRALVEAYPEEKFDLGYWEQPAPNGCGTLFCAGGLLGSKKLFGLKLRPWSVDCETWYDLYLPALDLQMYTALAVALGLTERDAQRLFGSRVQHPGPKHMTDKALFLRRCDELIAKLEKAARKS